MDHAKKLDILQFMQWRCSTFVDRVIVMQFTFSQGSVAVVAYADEVDVCPIFQKSANVFRNYWILK